MTIEESCGKSLAKKLLAKKKAVNEAVTVNHADYHWGHMVTVHHGSNQSFPLHPNHQRQIKMLQPGERTKFKDETGSIIHAFRTTDDKIHLRNGRNSKHVSVSRKELIGEEVEPIGEMYTKHLTHVWKYDAYGKHMGWGGTKENPGSYKIVKKSIQEGAEAVRVNSKGAIGVYRNGQMIGDIQKLKNGYHVRPVKGPHARFKSTKECIHHIAKCTAGINEDNLSEAKPDAYYQEWPGKKPKKMFNLSKYLENNAKKSGTTPAKKKKIAKKSGTTPAKKKKIATEEIMNEDYLHTDLIKAGAQHAKGMSDGNTNKYNAYMDHHVAVGILKKHGFKPQSNYTDFKHPNGSTAKLTHGGNGKANRVSYISVNHKTTSESAVPSFLDVLVEDATTSPLHKDLIGAGLKHQKTSWQSPTTASYYAAHNHEDVAKVLHKHGFKPVTHYKLGGDPMPQPYKEFEKDHITGGHASLHMKDGKVHYVTVNHRKSFHD